MTALPYPSAAAAYSAYAEHLNRGRVQAYRAVGLDLVMGERDGVRFRDAYTGEEFYDVHCNGGLFNLGHRNPQVIDAVHRALDRYDIGNHHLVSGVRARLAERLAATTGGRLSGVVFGASASEMNDLAIKLAWGRDPGRRRVVSIEGAYHGDTGLAVAASAAEFREPFAATRSEFVCVPLDDLDAMTAAVDDHTACVILEPVVSTLGMRSPAPGYLRAVEEICRQHGALFVLDEVQTGLGRTGTFWCHEQDGLTPDVVVTGKGLAGGIYPMSAALMTDQVKAQIDANPFAHYSTFAGSELGCCAAMEVLDITDRPEFLARVRRLSDLFADELAGLPFELRRRGLLMAFEFGTPGAGITAALRLADNGVFAWVGSPDASATQFLPPLVVTEDEALQISALVRKSLA
jgi:acetylornithine/succinyldiaminopimelate/putrescine aminotransferase